MLNTTSTVMERTIQVDPFRAYLDALDLAGKMLERQMTNDSNFPSLITMMRLSPDSGATLSGQNDSDYPSLGNLSAGLANLKLLKTGNKTPLPREVMEHFGHMQFHCTMGLFPEIHRAFLTIDSDIFVWTYEHGSDVAYFDGLGETILCVGLVKPKPGVFNSFVRCLLVLVTTIEIVILGVTFTSSADGPLGPLEEMNVIPEPVFVLPTEGVTYTSVASSENGRIFLGGKDGNLYEVVYQAEGGWFSKRCRKVNHSQGTLSYLLPSFLNVAFSEEDPISQIAIDDGRHILYTLSNSGAITVFDMGSDGLAMSRTTMMQQTTIVQHAIKIVDKTLDSSNFRPLVSICPIDGRESPHLNLVGVTQTGTRLYFTCGSVSRRVRPYSLNLLHVRLPPGYAANPPSYRPANVHTAHYHKGNTILISSPGGDHDMLQCLSSDAYPFHPYLVEVQTAMPVDGVVWALAEVKNESLGAKLSISQSPNCRLPEVDNGAPSQVDPTIDASDPPLIVTQHMEPPKKYVVLTPQGAEVLIKLRPVDLLRQILIDCRGPENEAVKTYFDVQQEDQACATCLILACLESARNAQVSEWATRAFFLYGGEPKSGIRQRTNINQMSSPFPYAATGGFNPTIVSTPILSHAALSPPPNTSLPSMGMNTPASADNRLMTFSSKHNGLYLYVSRILRPIWLHRVSQRVTMDNSKQFLVSSVSGDDCVWILGHLHALRAFLDKNSQLSLLNCSSSQVHSVVDRPMETPLPLNRAEPPPQNLQQEAQLEEKRSLDSLKTFLAHVCEVLGLWKVLSDHQFHCLADGLSQDDQTQLAVMTFRDLILVGHGLCSALINSLIKSYLNDDASVDSVSAKLREVCPKLYRNEDAACNKANEMLLKAKTKQNVDEKEVLMRGALKLCKEVAPNLNLSAACAKFVGVHWYEGVLELCLAYAAKVDPKDVAIHYYNNGEPSEDSQGCTLYMQRMDAYKEFISLLDQLYVQGPSLIEQDKPSTSVRDSTLDSSTQNAAAMAVLPPPAKRLISRALRSEDTLCHVAIYEWMLRRRLEGELLSGGACYPELEAFLARASRLQPDSLQIADLLWKFYERNQNHAAAAQILHQLATKNRNDVSLKERVSYLARAVMCMRSDKVGAAPHLGVFLRELEDLMEVVRVQQQILNAISNFQRSYPMAEAAQAIQRLNSCLFDMTQLYQEFAEPFELWECKLAIIHVSGHMDPTLIENIWLYIIDQEMKKPAASTEEKLSALMGKVKALGREYALASRSFPIPLLVKALEVQVCRARGDPALVHSTMLATGVTLNTLLDVYEKMIATNDRCWLAEGNEFHLVQAVALMVDTFTNNPNLVNNANRRAAVAKSDDVVSKCLNDVYSKPGNAANNELIERLRAIQVKLNRMAVR